MNDVIKLFKELGRFHEGRIDASKDALSQAAGLATDTALIVISRPYDRGAALHHRTIDLDVSFIAADSRDPVIRRSDPFALKGLTISEVGEFCGGRSG